MSFPWQAYGVEARLKKLWTEDGLSLAKIAADLSAFAGVPLTRNAVIGRVMRLGLVKAKPADDGTPASPEGPDPRPAGPPQAAKAQPDPPKSKVETPTAPAKTSVPAIPDRPRVRANISVTDLRAGQCKFPITPHQALKHFFCADPVEAPGATYCSVHAPLCFDRRTPQQRRADQDRAARAQAGKEAA